MIQFTHIKRKDAYKGYRYLGTLALEVPNKQELNSFVSDHLWGYNMRIGLSLLSEKDNYNKKIGRDISSAKMDNKFTTLRSISIDGHKHIYNFASELKVGKYYYKINFFLTTVIDSDKVYLINATIERS